MTAQAHKAPDLIKLGLGNATMAAAALDTAPNNEALSRMERGKGWVRGTREDLLETLYYIESCPAAFADGADAMERSAVVRTSRAWRSKLAIGENEIIPIPRSAERDPNAPRTLCDACGLYIHDEHITDDEICGGTDGPGFFLCARMRCALYRDRPPHERRALYKRQRKLNEEKQQPKRNPAGAYAGIEELRALVHWADNEIESTHEHMTAEEILARFRKERDA